MTMLLVDSLRKMNWFDRLWKHTCWSCSEKFRGAGWRMCKFLFRWDYVCASCKADMEAPFE